MKSIKRIGIAFFVGLIIVAFAGCSQLLEFFENDNMRKNTEIMLNAILEDDIDAAYAIVDETCTKEDFVPVFAELKELFVDTKSYDLSILSIYRNKTATAEGTYDYLTATYKMTISTATYIIDVKIIYPQKDLSMFYITPYEKTNYYSVGTFSNMSNASVFQWIMLLSNLVIIGFILFALFDCCRQKIKLKVLWLFIIVFGIMSMGITIAETSFNLNFNIGWLFAYNAHITYGSGMNVIRFMLPVGAIVYFILRNRMIRKVQICETNTDITPIIEVNEQNSDSNDNLIK